MISFIYQYANLKAWIRLNVGDEILIILALYFACRNMNVVTNLRSLPQVLMSVSLPGADPGILKGGPFSSKGEGGGGGSNT